MEIVCRTSLRCFELNRKEFSPYYKHDDEVLFLDGNCLKVLSVEQINPSIDVPQTVSDKRGKKPNNKLIHIKLQLLGL